MADQKPAARTSPWKSLVKTWETRTQRQIRDRDEIGNPLKGASQDELDAEIESIVSELSGITRHEMRRAVEVAKEAAFYYAFSGRPPVDPAVRPPVALTADEKIALVAERETMFSQGRMVRTILSVSLCGVLQGFVQSSINAASLYYAFLGIPAPKHIDNPNRPQIDPAHDFPLGAMNASPYLAAALVGAPMSLVANYWWGRRGSIVVSAILIIVSSVASAFVVDSWAAMLGVRIIGGVGMGVKAISAPILASETAVGYWRGSIILQWQLWVAFGIMLGFAVNLGIADATGAFEVVAQEPRILALKWILAAPAIPALLLLVAVSFAFESPRYYLRHGTPHYNPARALDILIGVRNTRLQALRDLFLIRWSNRTSDQPRDRSKAGLTYASQMRMSFSHSLDQYRTLFKKKRLRNAAYSACTVAFAQQCCGINVFAFYSNSLFSDSSVGNELDKDRRAMLLSLGFGAVNFGCGLFAIRSIDTVGRRRWLLTTVPLMSLFLMIAAVVFDPQRLTVFIVFIYLFVAAYSPGLGPIPFTLAAESFPLSHREAGASIAIAINLFFAGILTIFYPAIATGFSTRGAIGFFSGLNVLVFVLVYFIVEETRRLSLEQLESIYEQPKRVHITYQAMHLRYWVKRRLLFRSEEHPPSYDQVVAGRTGEGIGQSDNEQSWTSSDA